MKIAYNPITELPLLSIPLDIDITFDLPGKVIYARGVRFLGTDTTYKVFKKHTDIDDTGGYSGLVPAPSYTKTITRFLREDGNWVALAGITPPDTELDIDSTNSVENRVITTKIQELILDINGKVGRNQIVTASEAGLAPKIGTSCETTINTLADEWVLASTKGGEPTWRKLPLYAFLETRLYVGEKDEPNNSATANGNTYLKLFDNTTLSNLYNIKGLGRTTVTTDSSGNITITTPDTISWDSIINKPETFTPSAHTHSTSHIINLAEYAKAETRDALSITDTLNQALGKLEYKADLGVTAYDWYKGVTAEDTDDIINKWHEIVDFIDSVAEGTDITDEFVTRKTPQTIIGQKTFSLSEEPLIIHRASDIGASYIRYTNNETLLGDIGIGGSGSTYPYDVYFNDKNLNPHKIYHSGNLTKLSQLTNDSGFITSSALSGYLPLSGGTIKGTIPTPLVINTTAKNEVGLQFKMSGVNKGWVGYTPNIGIYLYSYGTSGVTHKLGISDSGAGIIDSYTLYHSGNLTKLSQLTNDKGFITSSASISGNAASATKLATARTIWGQSFDGTGDVSGNLSGVGTITRSNAHAVDVDEFGNLKFKSTSTTDNWSVKTNGGAQVLSVYNNGNVGIGTTSPAYKLDVNGKIRSTSEIWGNLFYFTSGSAEKGWFGSPNNAGSNDFVLSVNSGNLRINTSNTERMRIDSSGNVGIGTTSPLTALHVERTASDVAFISTIKNNANPNSSGHGVGLKLSLGGSTETGKWCGIAAIAESSYANQSGLALYSSAVERIRINGSGDVGIGTTSPSYKLHVEGVVRATYFKAGSSSYDDGSIELYGRTPYIDFHYGRSTADHTTRLIEGLSGQLTCTGKFRIGLNYTTSTDYNLYVNGTLNATTIYQNGSTLDSLLGAKLNSSSYTAADVLAKLKTVDGSGSGLDADTIDGYHYNNLPYLLLAGGTMNQGSHVVFPGTSTDTNYGGSIEFREVNYVTTSQTAWSYAPGITFHWGGRTVGKLGLRSDGNLAWRNLNIIHSGNIGSQSVSYANSAGSVAWGNITGKPSTYTPASHTHTLLSYDSTTTFGENCMLYKQTDSSFDGNSGWSHYLVFNHGNGATYYHYNVAFPFYGPPKYKRLTGSTSSVTGWYTLISTENIGSQSVNYATSAGSVAWANVTGKPSFFSGNYNDLTNKPTIPSVGNGTITIKQAGSTKGSFTMNLSGNTTIELTDSNTTYSFSNSNPTLAWGTKSTIGTVGGTALTVTMPANPNTDTHWTTRIYAGASGTAANAAATSPYLKVTDNNTYRNQVRFVGRGATTVSSDANGNITISSTDTNTWRPITDTYTGTATDTSVSLSGTNDMYEALVNGDYSRPVVLLAGTLYRSSAKTNTTWYFTGIRHRAVSSTNPTISVNGGVARFYFTPASGYGFSIYAVNVNHQASGEAKDYTNTNYNIRSSGLYWFGAYASGNYIYIRAMSAGNDLNDSSISMAGLWNGFDDGVTRIQIIAVGYAY